MNDRNSLTTFLPITVGRVAALQEPARSGPIEVPLDPDGTMTLSGHRPQTRLDHARLGQEAEAARDGKHIPAVVGVLERRLTARLAFEGNELILVDGALRLRRGC